MLHVCRVVMLCKHVIMLCKHVVMLCKHVLCHVVMLCEAHQLVLIPLLHF